MKVIQKEDRHDSSLFSDNHDEENMSRQSGCDSYDDGCILGAFEGPFDFFGDGCWLSKKSPSLISETSSDNETYDSHTTFDIETTEIESFEGASILPDITNTFSAEDSFETEMDSFESNRDYGIDNDIKEDDEHSSPSNSDNSTKDDDEDTSPSASDNSTLYLNVKKFRDDGNETISTIYSSDVSDETLDSGISFISFDTLDSQKKEVENKKCKEIPALEFDYDKEPTKLYCAIDAKNWKKAKALILESPSEVPYWVYQKDSNVDEDEPLWRFLPIHAACFAGAPFQLIKLLVHVYPDGLKMKTSEGKLAIHFVCEFNADLDIIAFLLSAYPDSFDMKDNYGCTPFKYVFVNKNVKKKSKVIKWMTDFATKKTLIKSFQYLAAQSNELISVLNEDTSRPQGKTIRSIYPAGKNSKNDKSLSSPRKTK